mmetsp:Transcript_24494/g.70611  ORF Transcript_24494/g.70611 Transcript_24494/m.70611 type:complete len:86 (-) Transcript_24494:1345-1602(-)
MWNLPPSNLAAYSSNDGGGVGVSDKADGFGDVSRSVSFAVHPINVVIASFFAVITLELKPGGKSASIDPTLMSMQRRPMGTQWVG